MGIQGTQRVMETGASDAPACPFSRIRSKIAPRPANTEGRNKVSRIKGRLISGSYFDFFRDQLGFLSKTSRSFGDFVRLRFFHVPVFLVSHPDLIEEVFNSKRPMFRKAKTLSMPSQKMLFGNSLLVSEGEFWLRQRRALKRAFSQDLIRDYSKIVVETAGRYLELWRDGEVRSIDRELTDLTFAVASRSFFGIDGNDEKAVIRELVDLNKSIFSSQNRLAWFWDNFLPTRKRRRFERAVGKVDELIAGLIRKRRAEGPGRKDLLSVLLSMQDADAQELTDRQLRDEIVTVFIAGHETTAVTLGWAWTLLAKHPEEFEKLKTEVETVLGGRPPDFGDLPKLVHAQRIIKESMRLFPPNRSTAREAAEECEIGGIKIPKGAQVVMPQWVVHRDERFYQRPDEFIPGRWTPEFEQSLHKYAYFPFGAGARVCIGRAFSMMETTLILAMIAQRFEITLDSPEQVEPVPLVLLRPNIELKATLRSTRDPRV